MARSYVREDMIMSAQALVVSRRQVEGRISGSGGCLLVVLLLLCSSFLPLIQGGKVTVTSGGAYTEVGFVKGGHNASVSLTLPNDSVVFGAKFDLVGKRYRDLRSVDFGNRSAFLGCNLTNLSVGYDRVTLDSQPYLGSDGAYNGFAGYRNPHGVAAGDLNGDGQVELAASYLSEGKAGFFPKRPDGTMCSFVEAPDPLSSPAGIAVGDINSDGLADLVVAEYGAGSLSVFYQNATTHLLDPRSSNASDPNPADVVLGDFNGDGLTDAAVCTGLNSIVYVDVFTQNATTKQLNASVRYTVTAGPATANSLASGDLTGDGLADIVVTASNNNLYLLVQQGGSFAPTASIALKPSFKAGAAAIGDLNGTWSGNETVVGIANGTLQGFAVFYQSAGSLAYGLDLTVPTQRPDYPSYAVGAGDVDSNGKADVVIGLPGNGQNNLTVVPQNTDGSLDPAVVYPAGNDFRRLALADLNADGKRDVAVACAQPDDLAVLLQNASSALGDRADIRFEPSAIAIGDLNNDGRQDVAIAARLSPRLAILLQGQVGWGSPSLIGPCNNIVALAIADVTGDQFPDLLALCRGNDSIALFAQNVGTLLPPVFIATGKAPSAMALGDISSDKKLEVVVAHAGDQNLSVYCQTGGSLTLTDNYTVGTGQTALALGDLNSDGKLDVAVARAPSDSVLVFNQTNAGKLASPVAYFVARTPLALAAGDIDTDSRTDLVSAGAEGKFTPLLQSAAGGLVSKADIDLGARPSGAAICDVNRDTRFEVCIWQENGNLSVFRQDNSGGLRQPTNISIERGPPSCAFGDLDRNGQTDLAAAATSGNFYSYLQKDYLGGTGKSYAADNGGLFLRSGDVNNDGYKDLVAGYQDHVSVFIQNPGGDLRAPVNYAVALGGGIVRGLAVGDLNKDGRDDVAITGHDAQQVLVLYQNAGGTLDAPQNMPFPGTGCHGGLVIGDVSGDGRADLIMADSHNNRVCIRLQNAVGGLDAMVTYATGGGAGGVCLGDVNNDNRTDVVVPNRFANTLSVLTQKNDGSLNSATSYTTSSNAGWESDAQATGDVNGDGLCDVVVYCHPGNVLDIFTQKNDGTLNDRVSIPLYGTDGTSTGVDVGDIDLDAKNEVVVSNSALSNLTVLVQDAQGNLYPRDNYVTGTNPRGLAIADLNADDIKDIAVINGGSSNLSVFYMLGRRGNLTIPPVTTPPQGGIDSAIVVWNQTSDPGSMMKVWLSTNGTNWTEVKNNTRVSFPVAVRSVHCRVDFVSSSTWSLGLLDLHVLYNYSAYPSDPSLDIGDDGTVEWSHAGRFTTKETFTGPWVLDALNNYLDAHRDSPGNITIPLGLDSSNEGLIAVTNVTIDYDQPPYPYQPFPEDLSVDEDTANLELLVLKDYFTDDFDPNNLEFRLINYTNRSIINVTIDEFSDLSVDAETGPLNDNWTGEVAIAFSVSDQRGLSLVVDPLIVRIAPVNDPPAITSKPNSTVATVGLNWSYQVAASDVENDPLKFVLDKGLAGMTLNTTSGLLTWLPRADQVDLADKKVQLRAYDGRLFSAPQLFTMSVEPNRAPAITSVPPVSLYVDQQYVYQVIATDPEGAPLTFSLAQRPVGMEINETTGYVTWRPTADQLGFNGVQVLATDGLNPVIQNFQVEVLARPAVNRPPVILNNPADNATVNQTYRHIVLANDEDGDMLTYSIDPKPGGMTVNSANGLILWTPQPWQVGNHTIVIRVSDGKDSVTQTVTIHVVSDVVPPPPKPKPPVKPADSSMLYAGIGAAVIVGLFLAALLFVTTSKKKRPVSAKELEEAGPERPYRPARPETGTGYRPSRPERGAGVPSKRTMVVKRAEEFEDPEPEEGTALPSIPPPEDAGPKPIPPPETDAVDERPPAKAGGLLEDEPEPELVAMDGKPAAAAPKRDETQKRELDSLFAKLGVEEGKKGKAPDRMREERSGERKMDEPRVKKEEGPGDKKPDERSGQGEERPDEKKKKEGTPDLDRTLAEIMDFKP